MALTPAEMQRKMRDEMAAHSATELMASTTIGVAAVSLMKRGATLSFSSLMEELKRAAQGQALSSEITDVLAQGALAFISTLPPQPED